MQHYDTPTEKEIESRIERALQTRMTIRPDGDDTDLYVVASESGAKYLVDARERSCSCYDSEQRGNYCKHFWRVHLETQLGFDEYPLIEDSDLLTRDNRAIADGGICEECASEPAGTLLCFTCYTPGVQEVRP